jgi:hypothetical protein
MVGAPYGIYGAPLLTPKTLLSGDIAVILGLGVVLMGMGHQYFLEALLAVIGASK